jgi:hypothetical protein
MKNYPNLFPLIFILLFSCSESTKESAADKEVETDLKKENLKGELIYLREEYSYNNNSPIITITEFSENGMKVKEIKKRVDGFDNYLKLFFYSNGMLDKTMSNKIMEGEKIDETSLFFYDENRNLVRRSDLNSISLGSKVESEYLYNNEILIKRVLRNGDYNSTETYYYSKKLDSTVRDEINGIRLKTKIHYDSNENPISEYIKYINGVESKYIYDYNEFGDVSKITFHKNDDNPEISNYTYTYDENGNWTTRIISTSDIAESTTKRKIYYKGDDYSNILNEAEEFIKSLESNSSNSRNGNSTGSIGSNRVPSPGNSSQSGGSIDQGNNSSQNKKCTQCNGTGQCRECSKTFRRNYYKGNGSYDDRNETKPGYVICSDCRGRGHKQVKRNEGGWEPGGDCHVSGCMDGWIFCKSCNHSGNGRNIGKCERCKGSGKDE